MTTKKLEKTFSQQMLTQLSDALSREKALTFIAQAKSQKDSGPVSRVFNDLGLNLPRDDLDTLLDAREKGGWFSFTKTIAKQVEPVINQLFYGEKPTPFDIFYNKHFAGTSFREEDIKSKLASGIITQYGECATAAMDTAYPDDPFFISDSISAINEVAKLIQTPEAVKASAQSTLNNPGPIKEHIETLQAVDQKKVAMLATNDISILYDDTVKARQALQTLNSTNPDVLQLIEILLKFEASMGGYALDPDDGPLEDALLVILKKLSGIREQIDALPDKGTTSTLSNTRQNISDSIKAIEPLLEKNLHRLEKAALQRLDLKLGISISEIIQTLDTQLTALEALTKKHAIFSKKDKPVAKNTQTAIDTIKEIRRTLIEDATALSVEHSIEAIPALGKKIAILNDALQQTATDLTTHTRGPIRQAIHAIFEPILKTMGDFIAWSTGYVFEGVAR
ncbi:MAG: hypothetical protein P1U32_09370, partial [Legionellaceae bacterium]|nr:hypothetical protein [Legionellaceae bacterium]